MKRSMKISLLIIAFLGLSLVVPGTGRAEDDDEYNTANELANAPAVRHRLLLVKGRLELSPAFESTVNADYKHTVGGGLKAEYHLSDMLSAGVVGFYGSSFNTGLVNRLLETLPEGAVPEGDPTPSQVEYERHLNTMPLHGGAYLTLTPWYGKLAAFGRAFVNFDFYFSGGLSVAQLQNSCGADVCTDDHPGVAQGDEPPDNDPNNDPALNDGLKLGVYLGGGIHVFINDFIALDFTVRDYMFTDNPSGLDFDADLAVTDTDSRFLNHLFMGVGISVFLPFRADRTN